MSKLFAWCSATVFCTAFASSALAAPIVYTDLPSSPNTVMGVNTQAPGNQFNPTGANYYRFAATAGQTVSINGDRLAGHYDMSFWILFGEFDDTTDFGPSFDGGDSPFVLFADDELPPNIAGPFGDPNAVFIAPFSGIYTLVVTNYLSSAGQPNPFQLNLVQGVQAVPEPGSLALWGIGAGIGLVVAKKRRKKALAA